MLGVVVADDVRLDAEADDADEKAAASDTDDQPLQPLRVGAVQCRAAPVSPAHFHAPTRRVRGNGGEWDLMGMGVRSAMGWEWELSAWEWEFF